MCVVYHLCFESLNACRRALSWKIQMAWGSLGQRRMSLRHSIQRTEDLEVFRRNSRRMSAVCDIYLVFSAFNGGLEFPFSKLSLIISMNLPIQHDGGDWRSMMGRASTLLFVDPNIKSYQIYLDLIVHLHSFTC